MAAVGIDSEELCEHCDNLEKVSEWHKILKYIVQQFE